MEKRLIIIDSNALLHRAFHALPPLTNKKGQPTGAVYGFLLILFRAIKDLCPYGTSPEGRKALYVVATFDLPKPTFRHEEFKDYKAHRARTPDEIVSQIPIMKEVLEAFDMPVFTKEGYEADDLIATIATKSQKDAEVFILSGDLDNLQLVNEKVKVYTMGKGIKDAVIYDKDRVQERFGVTPEQMIDFKALTGDPSDNISGVEGIGKKTAAELIQKYGNLKNLYDELSTDTAVLKPRVKEALMANKETAFLSLRLVETVKDAPIDFDLDRCQFGSFDRKKVEAVFRELDFNTLASRLDELKKF